VLDYSVEVQLQWCCVGRPA